MLINKDNAKTRNNRQAFGVLLVVTLMIGVAVAKTSDLTLAPVAGAQAQSVQPAGQR